MIYILLLMLITLFFLSYRLCNREILSPGFFCVMMYLFGTVILFFKRNEWSVQIQVDTILIIFIFLFSILVGDLIVTAIAQKRRLRCVAVDTIYLKFSRVLLTLMILVQLITLLVYFRETIRIASAVGWSGNLLTLLQYARIAKNVYGMYVSSIAQYLSYVCEAVNYVCLFIFINNVYICKTKIKQEIYYLFPTFLYAGVAILTTGRTLLLRIFMFLVVVFILQQYKNSNGKHMKVSKTANSILLIIVFAAIIFFKAGSFTGKSIDRNFTDYIAVYTSSGLAALNEYMKNPIRNTDTIWGGHTLFGMYTILRKFIKSIPILSSPLEMLKLPGGQTTNIYTPIRRYFQDFGYIGVIIIGALIGSIYKIAYNQMKLTSDPFKILLIGYMFFPLIEIAIEERIFLDLLTLKTAVVILAMCFLYFVCCKKGDREAEKV